MRISDWSSDVCSSDLFPSHDTTLLDVKAEYFDIQKKRDGTFEGFDIEIDLNQDFKIKTPDGRRCTWEEYWLIHVMHWCYGKHWNVKSQIWE